MILGYLKPAWGWMDIVTGKRIVVMYFLDYLKVSR